MYIRYLVIVLVFLCWGCDDNPSTEAPPPPCTTCDTCDNYYPNPKVTGPEPRLGEVAITRRGCVSPNGRYFAFVGLNQDYAHSERVFPIQGMSIMDLTTHEIVYFESGSFISWAWSPDSKKLYYLYAGLQPIREMDIDTKQVVEHTNIGDFEWIDISPSGNYIFGTGVKNGMKVYGIVRWNLEDDTAQYINKQSEMYNSFMVVDDSTICSIVPANDSTIGKQGIYYMNVNTKEIRRIECPSFKSQAFANNIIRGVISPDKKKVLFDSFVDPRTNDWYFSIGVLLLDLESLELRTVLSRHPHYKAYERKPRWSSNNTFIASWHCKKDSTTLLYEYDLHGRPLRQLTRRELEFWKVGG